MIQKLFMMEGKNTYSLEKDGRKHTRLPLKDEAAQEESESNILLMTGKEMLQEVKKEEMENPLEQGESLMMKIVLVKTKKEVHEPTQMKSLFRTKCKSQGKCCKVIIDSGSTDNLVSTEMVEKLVLERMKHPIPYKVSRWKKGHQLLMNV